MEEVSGSMRDVVGLMAVGRVFSKVETARERRGYGTAHVGVTFY
jgi:hypothetical protein